MIKHLVVLALALVVYSGAQGQTTVETIRFSDLQPRLEKAPGEVLIVNFWATWCGPCVKELPYFEEVGREYADKGVKVLLVSLDFPRQKESRLIPFIEANGVESEVVLLDETDFNAFIDLVSPEWSGAIPATLFISGTGEKAFYGESFEEGELQHALSTFMN